jgi:hypothetical protein
MCCSRLYAILLRKVGPYETTRRHTSENSIIVTFTSVRTSNLIGQINRNVVQLLLISYSIMIIICTTFGKGKGKQSCSCWNHEGIWETISTAPLIFNLDATWGSAVSFTLRLLYPRSKSLQLSSTMVVGWPLSRSWRFGEQKSLLRLTGIEASFAGLPTRSLVQTVYLPHRVFIAVRDSQ